MSLTTVRWLFFAIEGLRKTTLQWTPYLLSSSWFSFSGLTKRESRRNIRRLLVLATGRVLSEWDVVKSGITRGGHWRSGGWLGLWWRSLGRSYLNLSCGQTGWKGWDFRWWFRDAAQVHVSVRLTLLCIFSCLLLTKPTKLTRKTRERERERRERRRTQREEEERKKYGGGEKPEEGKDGVEEKFEWEAGGRQEWTEKQRIRCREWGETEKGRQLTASSWALLISSSFCFCSFSWAILSASCLCLRSSASFSRLWNNQEHVIYI